MRLKLKELELSLSNYESLDSVFIAVLVTIVVIVVIMRSFPKR